MTSLRSVIQHEYFFNLLVIKLKNYYVIDWMRSRIILAIKMTYYITQENGKYFHLNCELCKSEFTLDLDTGLSEEKIYASCTTSGVFRYIAGLLMRRRTGDPFTKNPRKLSILEIEPETIFHQDPYVKGTQHISCDFDVVRSWAFNTEFIKHLLQDGLTIEKDGHYLMCLAIKIRDMKMVDYLIDVGVDINYQIERENTAAFNESGFYYTTRLPEIYAAHNYADLAIESDDFEVLRHILDRGCCYATSTIEACIYNDSIRKLMPYIKVNEMSLSSKCETLSILILSGDVDALKMFEKAGLVITNEMADGCGNLAINYIDSSMVKYLISLGISAKHFRVAYRQAIVDEDSETIEQIEKAGIFEYYKPAEFLAAAVLTTVETVRHILDLGVDSEQDQIEIREAFSDSLRNVKIMKILEAYVNDLDPELASQTLAKLANFTMREGEIEMCMEGIDRLISSGAKPQINILCMTALSNMSFLELMLRKFPEIDLKMDVAKEIGIIRGKDSEIDEKCSLLEVVVFLGPHNFESVLNLMLERLPDLDADRLMTLFQKIAIKFSGPKSIYGNYYSQGLLKRARFLAEKEYLSHAFVESLGIKEIVEGSRKVMASKALKALFPEFDSVRD